MRGEQRTWRAWCRHHAATRAEHEAQGLWNLAPDEPAPYHYRWEHVQEVVNLSLWLAREVKADLDVVEAAAWLHDIRKGEPEPGRAGAQVAEQILLATDYPARKIEPVVVAIRQHVGPFRVDGSPPLEPIEAAVLWDADKLSELGVRALIHYISSAYLFSKSLEERRRKSDEYVRTVLLRTKESMNTAPARKLAARRYQDMVRTLDAWQLEERETRFG